MELINNNKQIEVIEDFVAPVEKGYCPECFKKMLKINKIYKCIKCKIEVELQ